MLLLPPPCLAVGSSLPRVECSAGGVEHSQGTSSVTQTPQLCPLPRAAPISSGGSSCFLPSACSQWSGQAIILTHTVQVSPASPPRCLCLDQALGGIYTQGSQPIANSASSPGNNDWIACHFEYHSEPAFSSPTAAFMDFNVSFKVAWKFRPVWLLIVSSEKHCVWSVCVRGGEVVGSGKGD